MKVADVMSRPAACCGPYEPLSEAARIMWDRDCGIVPIVESVTNALLGVVTDRDVCMAAYTQGRRLSEVPIEAVMCSQVITCRGDESVERVHERLRTHAIRRLVVVDEQGCVEGVVSLNDLARAAEATKSGNRDVQQRSVAQTLAEVCRPHAQRNGEHTVEIQPARKQPAAAPVQAAKAKPAAKSKPPAKAKHGKGKKGSKAKA